jgi:hypothetical protein
MKEKVAVATVQGKAYFLIVNQLREQNIPFISLVPGQSVPAKMKLVITTEHEKYLINHDNIVVFYNEDGLDSLVDKIKVMLLGKEAFRKIVVGIDPGKSIGLAAIADGKVIEKGNCFSTKELIDSIHKVIRHVNFGVTNVSIKIGNGVPYYKEVVEGLDDTLPPQVVLEVVGEAGTNKPLKKNKRSRVFRHISSATNIAGRTGNIVPRRKAIEAYSRTQ